MSGIISLCNSSGLTSYSCCTVKYHSLNTSRSHKYQIQHSIFYDLQNIYLNIYFLTKNDLQINIYIMLMWRVVIFIKSAARDIFCSVPINIYIRHINIIKPPNAKCNAMIAKVLSFI